MPCPPSLHHLQSRCKEQRVFWQRELRVEKQQRQNYERNNTEKQQSQNYERNNTEKQQGQNYEHNNKPCSINRQAS